MNIKEMTIKAALIIIGILIVILGLYLSFGIIMYSGKERDDSGYYYLIISFAFLFSGLFILRKGIVFKLKSKNYNHKV